MTDGDDTDGLIPDVDRPETEESMIGRWTGKAIATIPKPMLGVRETLFKRLAVKSINNYYKTISGADAIAINAKAGQRLDLEPVAYRPPDQCEEDESPGWYAKDRDKTWHPATDGNSVNFLGGKTPTVILEDDDHVEAGFLAPRIGQAIELDNWWPVFTDANINAVIDAGPAATGARSDGGMNVELELDSPGEWAGENVIDLDSGPHDGMRITTAKAKEWRAEQADSEAMKRAEDRGRLMEALSGDDSDAAKIFLYAVLLVLGVLGIVFVLPKLLSGGGGGGGINPLIIGLTGLL